MLTVQMFHTGEAQKAMLMLCSLCQQKKSSIQIWLKMYSVPLYVCKIAID